MIGVGDLFLDRFPVGDFRELVARFPDEELRSPTRSNIPLLALIKDGGEPLNRLLAAGGLQVSAELHLEYTVGPTRGRGKASHTDLMAFSDSKSLAVEAKWTEPRYDTVDEWLAKGSNRANREAVLQGWVDLLEPWSHRRLQRSQFGGCVYQLVHRAASACANGKTPELVYLNFDVSGSDASLHYCRADLKALWEVLGEPKNFRFSHVQMALTPTQEFNNLRNLPKGEPETANAIREALLGGRLFDFGAVEAHAIVQESASNGFIS